MSDIICTFDIPAICGLGLHMQLDGFRLLYTLIATFMWIVSTIFSVEYMAHYQKKFRYYFFLIVTYIATVGVFLSVDFYTTFIFFEIMSLASYVWVAQDERPESLRAAGTYLAVAVIGGLVMLMGIFLLYNIGGTVRFDQMIALRNATLMYKDLGYSGPSQRLWIAALCLLFGFGAKAGAFPLHIWLPKAHPVAPAPASALLSGILTKAGVYGMLILTCYIFLGEREWGQLILILGVCTMVLGALLAVFSIDLKRTLACSSVSQIGFIMTGIGMAGLLGAENGMALRGSLLHMVNHSLIKLVLFSAAGVVFMNIHSLNLNDVRGFGRKKPLLNAIFLSGALGIGGIPLFNGYVSKTLIHESIVEYSHIAANRYIAGSINATGIKWVEWLFLISGGFTVAYMTKLYVCIFLEKNLSEDKQAAYDAKKKYMNPVTALVLSISAIILPILGFTPNITMDRLADMSSSFMNASKLEHAVHYFSAENLKGAAISIIIGVIVYFGFVRISLMEEVEKTDATESKKEYRYINAWPDWLDLENSVYRPVIMKALPFVFGTICRFFDSLVDWLVVGLRKTIYRDSPIKTELAEGTTFTYMAGCIANFFQAVTNATVRRNREKKNVDYVHRFALKHVERRENRFMIVRSMSFGLMLFCMGLVVTVIYIFVRKLMM